VFQKREKCILFHAPALSGKAIHLKGNPFATAAAIKMPG
jgi:hypothetical protein